jgi:SAM-dependent methyltransferase
MNRFLNGVARAMIEAFPLPGPVLEIGSYQVAGQEQLTNLRGLFPDQPYLGIDIRPGPGVDQVANVETLPFADATFGTVIALSTFEHVRHFWQGFEEVYRVLRTTGVFLVACPFYFHQHNYPCDYWRFTPDALDVLLEPYPIRVVGWHGPARRPANVWAAAFREAAIAPTAEQFAHYQFLLRSYARQPMRPLKLWRYRVGRVICGRRPFAPHLDAERWETRLTRAA